MTLSFKKLAFPAAFALATTLTFTACEEKEKKQTAEEAAGGGIKTVKIGEQVWMAENLNIEIGNSKCYGNDSANCDKYGRLYNWRTALKACPKGWHLPSDKDWNVLMKFVNPSCSDNSNCDDAGTKLKATNGWNSKDGKSGNGTDEYDFAALPGGRGLSNGKFDNVSCDGAWWSASENDAYNSYIRRMSCSNEHVLWDSTDKARLFSIRCLQD